MRQERIALVVSGFPALSETFIVSKFLGLLKRGWNVHIVCGRSKPEEWARFPELLQPGLRKRVHVSRPHRPRSLAMALYPAVLLGCMQRRFTVACRYLYRGINLLGANVFRCFYLDAELIRLAPTLIHFEFGTLAVGRMYLKELLGCKVVVSFRGYDLNYIGLEDDTYYKEVWERADALHLLGEDLWRRAQRRGCSPNLPHVLIPPSIDTTFFDPAERCHNETVGTMERPLRILSVGRLHWKKGYEYALQAVCFLKARGLHCEYRIVGDGDYLEPIAFARHQLDLEDEVYLLGSQPREEVRKQMLWADVFLHSAVSEGFCNAVIEAQAMRLPVVCTDADGLSENVAHGETGFVVPRRNPEALAEKLAILARDPALRHRMGEMGRKRVLELFHLEKQIDAFHQFYLNLLAVPEHD